MKKDIDKLEPLIFKYFDILLKDLYYFEEKGSYEGEPIIYKGWRIPGQEGFVFMYDPNSIKINEKKRSILYYWGAFFEPVETTFGIQWFDTKRYLEKYLREHGFEFSYIS